jgi:hypothetical protein
MQRRTFLQSLVAAPTALAVASSVQAAGPANISVFIPNRSSAFLSAWRASAARLETFSNTKELQAKLERTRPALAVVYGDDLEMPLAPIAAALRIPIINAELGVRVPRTNPSAFVVRHSLEAWKVQWALGAWSAKHLGLRTALLAAPEQLGYDLDWAFEAGLESAGGHVVARIFSKDNLESQLRAANASSAHILVPSSEFIAWRNATARVMPAQRITCSALLGGAQSWIGAAEHALALEVQARVSTILQDGSDLGTVLAKLHAPRASRVITLNGRNLVAQPEGHSSLTALVASHQVGYTNLYQTL